MATPLPTLVLRHPFITAWILFFTALLGACIYAASIQNFDIEWSRNVPSKQPVEELGHALSDLETWPVFHHHLKQATIQDEAGIDATPKDSELSVGKTLHYWIEPPQKQWKRFEFFGKIREYIPEKRLEVVFESDSTGKITKLFDRYSWWVEVEPASEELIKKGFVSLARGGAQARTINWRGRFFGLFAPRILMNQVYYLDLVKLGTLSRQIDARKTNSPPNYQ